MKQHRIQQRWLWRLADVGKSSQTFTPYSRHTASSTPGSAFLPPEELGLLPVRLELDACARRLVMAGWLCWCERRRMYLKVA